MKNLVVSEMKHMVSDIKKANRNSNRITKAEQMTEEIQDEEETDRKQKKVENSLPPK